MKALARKSLVIKRPPIKLQKIAWIVPGVTAIHNRSGNRYVIDVVALDKTHDQKVVVYRSCVEEKNVYVRELHEFAAKFYADEQLPICLE